MARLLVRASSNRYVAADALGITAYPFAFMGRVRLTNKTNSMTIVAISRDDGGGNTQRHSVDYFQTSDTIRMLSTTAGGAAVDVTQSAPNAGEWFSFIARYIADQNRVLDVNGSQSGNTANSMGFGTGINTFQIGTIVNTSGTFGAHLDADVADFAVISGSISDEQRAAFHAGFSPTAIFPTSQIIEAYDFFGHITNEPGLKGNTLTPNGTPAQSAHPESLYYPFPQQGIASGAGEVVVGDPEGSLVGGKLIRGGLLLHGVLGR